MEQPNRGQQWRATGNGASQDSSSTAGKRNRRKNRGKQSSNGTGATHQGSSFKGKYHEMNGHVFQCYEETSKRDQFEKTVEELGRYASTYFSHATDMKMMLKSLREIVFVQPVNPPFSATRTTIRIWDKEVDMYMEIKSTYSENKWAIYAVVIGQCSDSMKTRLNGVDNFATWDNNHDVVLVLREIKAISNQFDSRTYFLDAYVRVISSFYSFKQTENESNTDYHSRFIKLIEVANHYGANLFSDDILIKHKLLLLKQIESLSDDTANLMYDHAETKKAGSDRPKAFLFIQGADPKRYRDLHRKLKEALTLGDNKYPATMADAMSILIKFNGHQKPQRPNNEKTGPAKENKENKKPSNNVKNEENEAEQEGVTLVQHDSGNTSKANSIPEAEMQLLQQAVEGDSGEDEPIHFLLTQCVKSSGIRRHWVLLDSQSTCHVFNNRRLLQNIRKYKKGMLSESHQMGAEASL